MALKILEELCGMAPGLSFPLASSFGWSLRIHLHYLAIGTSIYPWVSSFHPNVPAQLSGE